MRKVSKTLYRHPCISLSPAPPTASSSLHHSRAMDIPPCSAGRSLPPPVRPSSSSSSSSPLSVAPPCFLIFPLTPARVPAIHRSEVQRGMPNASSCVCSYIHICGTYICVFATTATETERVKVAESAGQHESTGNVSRELGVGVTAASVWMRGWRRGGEGGVEMRGNARARAYAIVCKVGAYMYCVCVCCSSYYTPLMHRVRAML